jgi:hypothetical protein
MSNTPRICGARDISHHPELTFDPSQNLQWIQNKSIEDTLNSKIKANEFELPWVSTPIEYNQLNKALHALKVFH